MLFKIVNNSENELRLMQAAVLKGIISGSFRRGVSISNSGHLGSGSVTIQTIIEREYPQYNCLSLPDDSNSFDIYLSDQVLEHVGIEPNKVFAEAFRVLEKNGVLLLSTCLLNPLHMEPDDFLRFTPYALEQYCIASGFTDIHTFTVGSKFDLIVQRMGGAGKQYGWFVRFLKRVLNIKMQSKFAIIVGVVARKPGSLEKTASNI